MPIQRMVRTAAAKRDHDKRQEKNFISEARAAIERSRPDFVKAIFFQVRPSARSWANGPLRFPVLR